MPRELAELIKRKVGYTERTSFLPETPDRVYEYLRMTDEDSLESVPPIVLAFFDALKLMTPLERYALSVVAAYSCPCGPPRNVHMNLDYLARLVGLPRDEVVSLFARLDALDVKSRIYSRRSTRSKYATAQSREIIEVKYYPLNASLMDNKNATDVMVALFECIYDNLCPDCARSAIKRLDLSVLGTDTGFPEPHETSNG